MPNPRTLQPPTGQRRRGWGTFRLFSKADPPPQIYIYRKSLPYIAIINRDGAEKATKMQGSRFATAETKSSNKVDNVLPLRNECCIKLIHPRWLSRFDDWGR